jgi:TRAP-type C4-dicarboxylate transport system permease small subunit
MMMAGYRIRAALKGTITVLEFVTSGAMWLIVALLALGGLERNIFGTAYMGNTDDVIGFLMAALFVLALPIALARGGHVRVDLFSRLYSPKVQQIAESAFKVFGILCGLGLTAAGIALVADSMARSRMYYGIVEIPIWIPQSVIVAGMLVFTLQFMFGEEERSDNVIQ